MYSEIPPTAHRSHPGKYIFSHSIKFSCVFMHTTHVYKVLATTFFSYFPVLFSVIETKCGVRATTPPGTLTGKPSSRYGFAPYIGDAVIIQPSDLRKCNTRNKPFCCLSQNFLKASTYSATTTHVVLAYGQRANRPYSPKRYSITLVWLLENKSHSARVKATDRI